MYIISGSKDFIEGSSPNSLKVNQTVVGPSLDDACVDNKFQLERLRFIVVHRVSYTRRTLLPDLALGFNDSWRK